MLKVYLELERRLRVRITIESLYVNSHPEFCVHLLYIYVKVVRDIGLNTVLFCGSFNTALFYAISS